jgi:hypothetical protein
MHFADRCVLLLGTFARVWLVRLASPPEEEDRDKVFALKVLRKAESEFAHSDSDFWGC